MDVPRDDARERTPSRAEVSAQPGEMMDLGPVDRDILWGRLALTQTQLAALAGLSQRQVSRWVAHGLLMPSSREPDRFNGAAVELAILMERAIVRGHRPTQAARIAMLALEKRANDEGKPRMPPGPDVRDKLLAAQAALRTALESLFPGGAARAQTQPAADERQGKRPR